MIGNTIEFNDYGYKFSDKEPTVKTGIVVDAYTDITGSISGKSEVFLGFGEGKTTGSTSSKRMYKVQYYVGGEPRYTDIHAWQMEKVIKFAEITNQEENFVHG